MVGWSDGGSRPSKVPYDILSHFTTIAEIAETLQLIAKPAISSPVPVPHLPASEIVASFIAVPATTAAEPTAAVPATVASIARLVVAAACVAACLAASLLGSHSPPSPKP